MPFFGYGRCGQEDCIIKDAHCHRDSPRSPALKSSTEGSGTPSEESIIQLTPFKSGAQAQSQPQRQSSDTSHSTSPDNSNTISPSPVDGTTDHPADIYRSAVWQPSLASGGGVDLSRTFTPTSHGTFSFGGQPRKRPSRPSKVNYSFKNAQSPELPKSTR